MHPKPEFTDPSGCMETVRAWLSAPPSRGFGKTILVFTRQTVSSTYIDYKIYLHRGEFFMSETMGCNTHVIAMLGIPQRFQKITSNISDEGNSTQYIGRIFYSQFKGCATSHDVYPMDGISLPGKAKRFGTFAELVCTHDLGKLGIKAISSTDDPHWSRIKQLSDCRLPISRETPIMDWKLGLSLRLRKFHSEARKPAKAASAFSQVRQVRA